MKLKYLLEQGIAAHKQGDLKTAELRYKEVLHEQPTNPTANHNLGLIAIEDKQTVSATPYFEVAVKANPKIYQHWYSYIFTLIETKNFDDAEVAIEDAKSHGIVGKELNNLVTKLENSRTNEIEDDTPSQQQLSVLLDHYQNDRLGVAEDLAITITQRFPKHPWSWKVLGLILHQTDRFVESMAATKTFLRLEPYDAEGHSNLGATLKAMGKCEDAVESYDKAIELRSGLAGAHYNLGITLRELGRLPEAEESYVRAIALSPRNAAIYCNLGIALQEQGKLTEAEASYRKAIELEPKRADSYYNLGIALERQKKCKEAEECYSQAIRIKPLYMDALRNRCLLRIEREDYEGALQDSNLCISKGEQQLDLTVLHRLRRTEEIYDRIKARSQTDGENISIAAFSSFIACRENKDTAYQFCPNPMEFLYLTNLSEHVMDLQKFTRAVIRQLSTMETIWEPSGKTTVNGFQSQSLTNLFKLPLNELGQLRAIAYKEIENYYSRYKDENCTFIKKWPSKLNTKAWHVILKQHGHQTAHIHQGGWLSGVIYLKVVPPLGQSEGAIEFSLNSPHYTDPSSPRFLHQPKVGDMILSPSSLHHRTIPFTLDQDRIIISFDVKPGT